MKDFDEEERRSRKALEKMRVSERERVLKRGRD